MTDFLKALKRIQHFEGVNLTERIANLEDKFTGVNKRRSRLLCSENGLDDTLLIAALALKNATSQIDTKIHAIGIMLLLPEILQPGELILSLSIGAGNTGKNHDLETNQRIAEFKFIDWKGGSESIRQNSLFKDFFYLAEAKTNKMRCLYVLGLEHPSKFLKGNRAIKSVTSKNAQLSEDFRRKHGTRFSTVSEYYKYRKGRVEIIDIFQIMPSLTSSAI